MIKEDSVDNSETQHEIEANLVAWRARALYIMVAVIVVLGIPAYLSPFLNALQTGEVSPLLGVYALIFFAMVLLAVAPRLQVTLRSGGIILLAYINAVASFARVGLAGSGRLYLLTLPIAATLMLGPRAGYLSAGLSLVIYAAFAVLANAGVLQTWITETTNPVDLGFWIEAGSALAAFVILTVALLLSFYRMYLHTLTTRQETNRKLEETARLLKEREERLALVIQGTDDGIWDWNLRTDEVYYSPRWKAMLGYGEDEIANRFEAWRQLVHPDDVGRAITALQAYLTQQSSSFELEHRLQHKDGSYRWILVRGIALWDDQGKPYRMAGSHTDITKQKRAEQELQEAYRTQERNVRERTRELSTLLEIVQTASGSLDLDQVLRRVARGLTTAVGIPQCGIYVVDEEKQLLLPKGGSASMSTENSRRYATRPLDPKEDAFTREIMTSRQPVICDDAQTDPRTNKETTNLLGLRSILGVPFVVKDKVVAVAMLSTLAAPTSFTKEQVELAWGIVNAAAVAIENARLYRAEHEGHAEAERRREVADGMREIVKILNSKRPLGDILQYIVTRASQLLGADAGTIRRYDTSTRTIVCEASYQCPPELEAVIPGHMADTTGNRTLLGGQLLAVSDLDAYFAAELANPQSRPDSWNLTWYRTITKFFRAGMAAPLTTNGQVYGDLDLYYREHHEFSEEDRRLSMAFADQIALAIENSRLSDQVQAAAAITERSRLARELHDSVTQSLYSMTLYAEAAARLLDEHRTAQAAEHLRDLRDTAQESLREMRLLIFELRPLALEKTGLAAAIQARLDSVETRGGMHAELTVEGEEHLASTTQQELYHIAQEALNNVLKHAHAQNVNIHLQYGSEVTRLEISDDGVGFGPAEVESGAGFGLSGMRERAQKIGATLNVESVPGKGTRICVAAPIP